MTTLGIILILYILGFLITSVLGYIYYKSIHGTRGEYFESLIISIFLWWIILPMSFYEMYLKEFFNKKL